MNESKQLIGLEKLFLALADKTRLRLLSLMRGREIAVCYFTQILGESQPKISRHLAYLRNAGLVETRREGKWIHYQIIEPAAEIENGIFSATLEALSGNRTIQIDEDKLSEICLSDDVPKIIARAPPQIFPAADVGKSKRIAEKVSSELPVYLL